MDRLVDVGTIVRRPSFPFGNASRGILLEPGNFNVYPGVHRLFDITERRPLSVALGDVQRAQSG